MNEETDVLDEQAFIHSVHQTMAGLRTDPDAMVERAVHLGGPIRRRRHLGTGVAATLAVATVGGLAALGISALGGIGGDASIGLGPSVAPAATPVVRPDPTKPPESTPPEAQRKKRMLDARTAALYLARLAPEGFTTEFTGQENIDEVYAYLEIDRRRAQPGKASLDINVQGHFSDPASKGGQKSVRVEDIFTCQDKSLAYCKVTQNDDGTVMRQAVAKIVTAGETVDVITVDFLRSDKARVTVRGGTSSLFGGGHYRPGTNLTQVTKIALSDEWDLYRKPSSADRKAASKLQPWTLLDGGAAQRPGG